MLQTITLIQLTLAEKAMWGQVDEGEQSGIGTESQSLEAGDNIS